MEPSPKFRILHQKVGTWLGVLQQCHSGTFTCEKGKYCTQALPAPDLRILLDKIVDTVCCSNVCVISEDGTSRRPGPTMRVQEIVWHLPSLPALIATICLKLRQSATSFFCESSRFHFHLEADSAADLVQAVLRCIKLFEKAPGISKSEQDCPDDTVVKWVSKLMSELLKFAKQVCEQSGTTGAGLASRNSCGQVPSFGEITKSSTAKKFERLRFSLLTTLIRSTKEIEHDVFLRTRETILSVNSADNGEHSLEEHGLICRFFEEFEIKALDFLERKQHNHLESKEMNPNSKFHFSTRLIESLCRDHSISRSLLLRCPQFLEMKVVLPLNPLTEDFAAFITDRKLIENLANNMALPLIDTQGSCLDVESACSIKLWSSWRHHLRALPVLLVFQVWQVSFELVVSASSVLPPLSFLRLHSLHSQALLACDFHNRSLLLAFERSISPLLLKTPSLELIPCLQRDMSRTSCKQGQQRFFLTAFLQWFELCSFVAISEPISDSSSANSVKEASVWLINWALGNFFHLAGTNKPPIFKDATRTPPLNWLFGVFFPLLLTPGSSRGCKPAIESEFYKDQHKPFLASLFSSSSLHITLYFFALKLPFLARLGVSTPSAFVKAVSGAARAYTKLTHLSSVSMLKLAVEEAAQTHLRLRSLGIQLDFPDDATCSVWQNTIAAVHKMSGAVNVIHVTNGCA